MSFLNAGMYQIPSKFVQGAAVLAYQQYTIRGYWHFLAPGVLEHFRFYFKNMSNCSNIFQYILFSNRTETFWSRDILNYNKC